MRRKEIPFQIYSHDQTPENFINAYNAYNAQVKDTVNYGAVAMLGWLNYYEMDRNLEVLKANADKLTDMKKCKKAASTPETGLSYYGKDAEDPEKEMTTLDVQFFYLDLLKKAGENAKYKEQYEKLQKLAPGDERLK